MINFALDWFSETFETAYHTDQVEEAPLPDEKHSLLIDAFSYQGETVQTRWRRVPFNGSIWKAMGNIVCRARKRE